MKNETVVNIEEVKEIEETMVQEPKLNKAGSKIATFGKKYGKKIVAGAAFIGVGLLGAALGSKLGKHHDSETGVTDCDFTEVSDIDIGGSEEI